MYNDTKAVTRAILEDFGKGGVTYERVKEHIESSGWQIMQYGNAKYNPGNAILQTLGLWEYAKKHESLAYSDDKRSVIFLNVKRKSSSLFLLIHEIAHIKSGDTIAGGVYGKDDPEAELQANKIANAVLKKANAKNPLKNHPFAVIGISVICTMLIVGTIAFTGMTAYINQRQQQPAAIPYQPPATQAPVTTLQPTPQTIIPQGQIVWLTPKGDKYHTVRNCPSIVNRTDLTELDEAEAIAKRKEKCQHCINKGG